LEKDFFPWGKNKHGNCNHGETRLQKVWTLNWFTTIPSSQAFLCLRLWIAMLCTIITLKSSRLVSGKVQVKLCQDVLITVKSIWNVIKFTFLMSFVYEYLIIVYYTRAIFYCQTSTNIILACNLLFLSSCLICTVLSQLR
jgi:hypothetical protein